MPPIPVPATSYSPGDSVPPGPAAADIGQIMNRVDTIGQSVSVLMHALQQQVIQAGTLKQLNRTMTSAAALSVQLQGVIAQQNRNISETMAAFRDAATHMSNAVDSAQLAATMTHLRQTSENSAKLVANLDSTNAQLRGLLTLAQNGNGTVGKLLTDSLLYSDLRHSVQRLDSLIADIKANPRKYINLKIF
jgi:phospholipid/cholesterol/gamma-HCH transport system substrate-binding protein